MKPQNMALLFLVLFSLWPKTGLADQKESPQGIVISDNLLYGNNMSGIQILGNQVTIEKCQIYKNGSSGIVVEHETEVRISSNQIHDQEGTGVTIMGKGAATVLIIDNHIYQNKRAGLNCGAKEPFPPREFLKNPVLYSEIKEKKEEKTEGEKTEGENNKKELREVIMVEVRGNRIYGNGEGGLRANPEYPEHPIQLTVIDNTFLQNHKGGLFIADRCEAMICNNFIGKNEKAGLAANKATAFKPRLDIYQNVIWKNDEAGLELINSSSGSIGVANNWILHNGGSGIRFESVPMRIVNNTIVSNGNLAEGSGIEQANEFHDFFIANNIITYNFKTGLSLKAQGRCSYNLLFANDGAGNCCDDCYNVSKLIQSKQLGGGQSQEGDLICDPVFLAPDRFDFRLKDWSPAIDAGLASPEFSDRKSPPSQGKDINDLGATGGPLASFWDPNIYLP